MMSGSLGHSLILEFPGKAKRKYSVLSRHFKCAKMPGAAPSIFLALTISMSIFSSAIKY